MAVARVLSLPYQRRGALSLKKLPGGTPQQLMFLCQAEVHNQAPLARHPEAALGDDVAVNFGRSRAVQVHGLAVDAFDIAQERG